MADVFSLDVNSGHVPDRVDFLPQRDVRIPKRAGGPIYPCIEKKFIELNPEGTITLR